MQPFNRFHSHPGIWFKAVLQTSQSLACSIMEKPHTGLDECPRILLSCFRARNSVANPKLNDDRLRLRVWTAKERLLLSQPFSLILLREMRIMQRGNFVRERNAIDEYSNWHRRAPSQLHHAAMLGGMAYEYENMNSQHFMSKRGGAGGRFGDFLGVDCANLPYLCGHNQFTNTKFTRPNTQISSSIHEAADKIAKPSITSRITS